MGKFSRGKQGDPEERKRPLSSWSGSSTSSTSTSPSSITFTREKSCSRPLVFCAVLTVLMAGLGAAAGIYFGFLSDRLDALQAEDMHVFRGRLRLTGGDSFSPPLADPSTAEYVRKAEFYRNKLDSVFRHSVFRSAFVGTEILGLDGHPSQDLIVHFNLRVDTRNIPVDAADLYIILAEELRTGNVFQDYQVDLDSVQIRERLSVLHSLPPDPLAGAQTTSLPEVTERTPPPRQCQPVELAFCQHMPYNATAYPNLLGHADLREINLHLIPFREVVDAECSRLARDFVCQLLQPACLHAHLVLPCQTFCQQFLTQCQHRLPAQHRHRIQCDRFPTLGQHCLPPPGCARQLALSAHRHRLCDGTADCAAGEDEQDCPACPAGTVRCAGETHCVPSSAVCDGAADCPRAGDERACLSLSSSISPSVASPEGEGFLRYNGWGGNHLICADDDVDDTSAQTTTERNAYNRSGTLSRLAHICRRLHFSTTELLETRPLEDPRDRLSNTLGEKAIYAVDGVSETTDAAVVLKDGTSAHIDGAGAAATFVRLQALQDGEMTFQSTACPSRRAIFVRCSEPECGAAPGQAPLRRRRPGVARAGDFPWSAQLIHKGQHLCDAALIQSNWLVSAAHCFKEKPRSGWRVRLGLVRLASSPPGLQVRGVAGIVRSPMQDSELVLIRLSAPAQLSEHVRPVCIDEMQTSATVACYTTGWQHTGELFYSPLEVESGDSCSATSSPANMTLCTRPLANLVQCQGSELAGAPLLCESSAQTHETGGTRWRLAGVSNRAGCDSAGQPASRSFHALHANLGWIRRSLDAFAETRSASSIPAA